MSDASQSIPQDGSAPTSATISFGDVLEKVGNGWERVIDFLGRSGKTLVSYGIR